ncbi:SH3 domain-containing protein [filamentous cyanobacterium LEGE 11480]|uniref:SH3 domain-containing protein n=1 Tax=Romeriopsis navalis LEGE 11480 TaxID=2777977 RepID=A0A928VQZ9_9CYAN|nr:SH3 domain-containing protein [Romeriopsis navalis]MBE9033066.1 SH3 domain-containing protein [Romeriopsis navalis LEGE 11480]
MKTAFSTRLPLVAGMWITVGVTLFGLGAATLRPKAFAKVSTQPSVIPMAMQADCQTVATDPQPPLNIRSQPSASSSQNIVGTAGNGTILKVIDAQPGWLKVSQPIDGWVHQPLTATSCANTNGKAATTTTTTQQPQSPNMQVIGSAYDRFEAGQLQAALALLQSIPQTDATYQAAQTAYQTMSTKWHQGHVAYQAAQTALANGQWQVVLNHVKELPDVSYWRAKMAPIVKQAIVNQNMIN